jgi:hypothetical protein
VNLSTFKTRIAGSLATLLLPFLFAAQAAENNSLRAKQQAQEKARALASDLASEALDLQLRQLQENGLSDLPIYHDVAALKSELDSLVSTEMQAVVQLLVEAQQAPAESRSATLHTARDKVREVVVRLMAQRQKLNRRMRIARLDADVRQLIALQTKTYNLTRLLPDNNPAQREQLALAAIEDQADVHKLYFQLASGLEDVSGWGAALGAAAQDGLRIIKAAQLEPDLKTASQHLAQADFAAAAKSQEAALKALAILLEKLEEIQGIEGSDRQQGLRLVAQARQRQEQLRQRSRLVEFSDRTTEPLIEEQTAIQKELAKLAESLAKFSTLQPLLEEAKAASFEATAQLFDARKSPALDHQNRVIASLAQMEKMLAQGEQSEQSRKSADELAAEIQRLSVLKSKVADLARRHEQASQAALENPRQAAADESAVADGIAQIEDVSDLPVIAAALSTAKEKVAQAQLLLASAAADDAQIRTNSAHDARVALLQLDAEIQSQLADTRRRHKAVELGELARAAEALERAAATEREITRKSIQTDKTGLDSQQAAAFAGEQRLAAEVAAKIAAGVQSTAPAAVPTLQEALGSIDQAFQQLAAANQLTDEASRLATTKAAAGWTHKAAEQLAKAAAEIRRQASRAAAELLVIAGEQFDQATTVRQSVQSAAETAKASPAEAIAQLEDARTKLAAAKREQARGEGRPELADAQELLDTISEVMRSQQRAEHAAQDLARGRANNPLDAASQQQDVADAAGQFASRAPADIALQLVQAAKTAAQAAKETLNGNPVAAATARQRTTQALVEAMRHAQDAVALAAQQQPSTPDLAALAKLAEIAADIQERLRHAALADSSSIKAALDALEIIRNQRGEQEIVARSLATATTSLDQALRQLVRQQTQSLLNSRQQLPEFLSQAAVVDPGASAALAQAQRSASDAALPGAEEWQAVAAYADLIRGLVRAQDNLVVREAQLRHDRDLADTLMRLASDQQTARDAISQAAQQLEQSDTPARSASEGSPPTPSASTPQQLAAAQALRQAQQQFAAAQRATGQGAVEISGQQEVANQSIREGLEAASRLNPFLPLPTPSQLREGSQSREGEAPAEPTNREGEAPAEPNQKSKIENPKSGGEGGPASDPPSSALGNGFVPATPEVTAQQIAGQEANAAASAAMAASQSQGQGQPGGEMSSAASKGGAAKAGKSENPDQAPGDPQVAASGDADSRGQLVNQDTNARGSSVASEPWFAKLPPSLQTAIQARARARAPRGYEERLRRYFQSDD